MPRKAPKRTPLIPFNLARDFQVGEPLNGTAIPHEGAQAECRDPNRDYSGADPDIQFPAGWHVKAGFGKNAGAFHQDISRFEPHRVRVMRDPSRPHTPRNVIRMQGGDGETGGSAELSKWFVRDESLVEVTWESGKGVYLELNVRPSDEILVRPYFNVELRGLLSFAAFKAESVECFGLHFSGDNLKAKYWRDGYDGITADKRTETKQSHPLQYNRWYQYRLQMTPVQPEFTWKVDATLNVASRGRVWELHTGAGDSPNGIKFISQITFGDEQENITSGGVFYIARAMVWQVGA